MLWRLTRALQAISRECCSAREFVTLLSRDEPAVLRHVTDCFLRAAQLLAEKRKVVVAIGHRRVGAQCRLVRLQRLRLALEVFQQDAEGVEEQRIGPPGPEPAAIRSLRLLELSRLVQ